MAKLKFLLREMNDLAEELSLLVVGCCDTVEDHPETALPPDEPTKDGGKAESNSLPGLAINTIFFLGNLKSVILPLKVSGLYHSIS